MNIPRDVISAAELGELSSAELLAFLTDTCIIFRSSGTDDAEGSESLAWVEIATDVPCRLFQPRSVKEAIMAGAVEASSLWKIQLPIGTDLESGDGIVKDDRFYEVLDTDAGLTNAVYLTAMLQRVRNLHVA